MSRSRPLSCCDSGFGQASFGDSHWSCACIGPLITHQFGLSEMAVELVLLAGAGAVVSASDYQPPAETTDRRVAASASRPALYIQADARYHNRVGLPRHVNTPFSASSCVSETRVRASSFGMGVHALRSPKIGPRRKGDFVRLIERTQGGMNSKLHAVGDANGRPFALFMTAGQVNVS